MRKGWLPLLAAGLLLCACGASRGGGDPTRLDSRRKTSMSHFGTVCFVVVYDDFSSPKARVRFEEAWEEIEAEFSAIEAAASVDLPGSDIAAFNSLRPGEGLRLRPETAEILRIALEMSAFTGGYFNPAVGDLVDLWGFSPRFRRQDPDSRPLPYDRKPNPDGSIPLPDPRYVAAFARLADLRGLELGGDASTGYRLTKRGKDIVLDGRSYTLKLDLGGIAKGYAAAKATEVLRRRGYVYGYVSVGMSSMGLLRRPEADEGSSLPQAWSVGLVDPDKRSEYYLKVFARDAGLSTSGTYELQYRAAGRDYSHIVDPKAGIPVAGDLVSAIVVGPDTCRADALTTALCAMGSERATAFMREKLGDYQVALLLERDGALRLETNMKRGAYRLTR